MARGHDNLQRDREEQLQLCGQLANVYDVIRDLGLHYEMKEISGCSFITIGRTEHKYSHLDKNLTWTVPTVRASDIQYVEQSNVIIGDDTVSASEKDETILSLHKSGQEQEEEIRKMNYQLTNLSSTLQAANNLANDEAGVNQGLSRTAQEQKEEIKKLNLQLSNLSSQIQANTEKEDSQPSPSLPSMVRPATS
jgi:valyl-tRNA synthetase